METMKDELCFFSDELEYTDNINYDQFGKLRCVKHRLVFEFEN